MMKSKMVSPLGLLFPFLALSEVEAQQATASKGR